MSIARIYTSLIYSGVAKNYLDCWEDPPRQVWTYLDLHCWLPVAGETWCQCQKNADLKCQIDGLKTRAPEELKEKEKESRDITEIIASSDFVMQRDDFFSCQRPNGKPVGKMTRPHRTRNHRGWNQYMKEGCDYSEIEPQYGADKIRTRRIVREENGKVTDLGGHFIFHFRFSG